MNFLYPGFLFALISVAIPVIIHLFNFRKFKKVYFSNIQLLKEVEQQNSSTNKIKNWLILASRILALIFLVLAFAQPYIPSNNKKSATLNNAVSIYIDNSYSMDAVNKEGSLLDEAKRRAKDVVKQFGINDRFQLLTNDFEGKQQRLLSADEFLKALDDVKISGTSRKLQQIINRQGNILTDNANKYSFIISDFQHNMLTDKKLESNADIQYSLLKINASVLPNIGLDSVYSLSPNHQPGATDKIVVSLKNYSVEAVNNIPIKLSINNVQKAISSANIAAGKVLKDTLSFSGLTAGWQKAVVSIKDFPLTFDDSLYFSFKVEPNFSVLNIKGANANSYIKTLYQTDKYYKLTEEAEGNINYNNFSNYGLIVLDGLKNPSTGLAQQLKLYLKNGGAVVIYPDLDADINIYNSFLTSLYLPKIEALVSKSNVVDKIELQHPIFKTVFEEIPKNIDLPFVNRYFSYKEQNNSGKENIMQLSSEKLFFAKFNSGKGQVFLSATSLSINDSNFGRHPVFVPLMFRLALNSGQAENLYSFVGSDNFLTTRSVRLGKNQTLKLTANGFETIPDVRQSDGKTAIYIADQLKNAGFYDLKLADSLISVLSFNTSRSESDMSYLTDAAIKKVTDKSNFKVYNTDNDEVKLIAGNQKIEQTFWKLCLILSLIFIAIEIFLIRYLKNPTKAV
jgi:hypothetical protein